MMVRWIKKFFYNFFEDWKRDPPWDFLCVTGGRRYLLSMAPCPPDGKNPKHTHSCSASLRAGVLFVFNRRRDRGCVLSRCKVKHGHPSHAKRDNTYTGATQGEMGRSMLVGRSIDSVCLANNRRCAQVRTVFRWRYLIRLHIGRIRMSAIAACEGRERCLLAGVLETTL